jgi:alcohol dehydrogenase class IV
MWFFRSPTVVFGEEALLHIREIKGERAFVVTDKNIQEAGLVAPVLFQLGHAGMAVQVFDEVEAEPTVAHIKTGAQAMDAFDPDWIVAIGGGSVMDAAKAMWLLIENPDIDLLSVNPLEPIEIRNRAGLIAVPTTAGTGSEVSWAIVLTDPGDDAAGSGNSPRKAASGHPMAMPDYAIVDPMMTAQMPAALTADTGLDALTQAIEAYVTTWSNDFTDGLALVATKLAFDYLPRAYANPGDIEAREKMANAASIGGLAYINSMVGAAHSMGHALGALLHLPHGRAVGLCLPYVIEYSASPHRPDDVMTRYADIARFVGLPAEDELSAAHVLAEKVRALLQTLNLPLTLEQAGISREQFDDALDNLIDNTMSDTVLFTAPRQPSEDDLRRLFECVYSGDKVNF